MYYRLQSLYLENSKYLPYELVGIYTTFQAAQEGLSCSLNNKKLKGFTYVIDTILLNRELHKMEDNDIWIAVVGKDTEFYHFITFSYANISELIVQCNSQKYEDKKIQIKDVQVVKTLEED